MRSVTRVAPVPLRRVLPQTSLRNHALAENLRRGAGLPIILRENLSPCRFICSRNHAGQPSTSLQAVLHDWRFSRRGKNNRNWIAGTTQLRNTSDNSATVTSRFTLASLPPRDFCSQAERARLRVVLAVHLLLRVPVSRAEELESPAFLSGCELTDDYRANCRRPCRLLSSASRRMCLEGYGYYGDYGEAVGMTGTMDLLFLGW